MKKIIALAILFLIFSSSKANMAEPVTYGSFFSTPFTSEYVRILHENIKIKIDENFQYAYFDIEYHIESTKQGKQIPLLFYAMYLDDDFKVSIDGKEIKTKQAPYDTKEAQNVFIDYTYLFRENQSENSLFLEFNPENGSYFKPNLSDLVYFETDIPPEKHVIKVSYKASAWIDSWDWINKYSFRYALSPAKHWKSYGTLSVTIDAGDFNNKLETNLGKPSQGNLNNVAQWEFDKMPVDVIMIEFNPEISKTAQLLLKIQPLGLSVIFALILALLHLYITWAYRMKHPKERFSPAVIGGSLLVPLFFVLFWIYSFYLIDSVIGEHASGNHAYSFLLIVFYPPILLFYWIAIWLIDRLIFKKQALND